MFLKFSCLRKTPVLESLFIELQVNFIKETPTQVFSSEFCEIFKNIIFKEQLRETASAENSFLESRSCFSTHIYMKKRSFYFEAFGDLKPIFEDCHLSLYQSHTLWCAIILCRIHNKNIMVLRYSFLFWRNR